MCDFDYLSTILRGFYRIKFSGALLTVLTILTCNSNTEGKDATDIHRINAAERFHGSRGNLDATVDRSEFLDNEMMLGHSGDPWDYYKESENVRNVRIRLQPFTTTGVVRNSSAGENSRNRRSKRSVVHLYNMVVCATGCNPMSYKGYGCYCGFLGSGSAVDGIDQCCRMHDRCYDATECPTFLEYFVPYYWKCYRGYRPICAIEHGKWGGSGSCAQRLCECDRALSECLRRFPCPTSKAVCTTSPWRLIQNVFMIF